MAIGSISCLSGKVIKIEASLVKLVGCFYIEEDEHIWDGRKYVIGIRVVNTEI